MSKAGTAFFVLSFALLCTALTAGNCRSQDIEATIKIDMKTDSVIVSGRNLTLGKTGERRNLSFLNSSIGMTDLAKRISSLELADKYGKLISYKRSDTGEFVADADFAGWSYSIKAEPPKDWRASGHVSWLSEKTGVLMLDDLLPQFLNAGRKVSATVKIQIPDDWKIVTTEKKNSDGNFTIANIEKAVFVFGIDIRESRVKGGNSVVNAVTSGAWLFGDTELGGVVSDIFKEYFLIFGSSPAENLQIVILPFPQKDIQKGTWEAETRGAGILVVSADMPFKTQSLQRLHEQLRHEIFHLWLPNGINLTGNYDWFYEGFALYRSLKAGVTMNQIRFEDFLDTLSRAHNVDSIQPKPLSLIEASQNRWNGADTQVYARGMLVAFLCDLSLLQGSKGKVSIDDIFRTLYNSHRSPGPPTDANTAIIKILSSHPQLAAVTESYINGSKKIDWQAQLDLAGIENEPDRSMAKLRVKAKLNGGQKALLDKLGYNSWRKLTRK